MRTSSYNIYVKLPEEQSYLIVQGYTGAVDCVSDSVYKYLMAQGSKKEQVSQETITRLKMRGYLTNMSFIEEREYLSKVARIIHEQHLREMGILFAPTFSCQLRCIYCYEAPISHPEDEFSQAVMTNEHVRAAYAAIDWIVQNLNREPPKAITLYGGEPLLAKNYDVVRQIVEEGILRKINFKAITNGYDLLKYEDLLGKDKIDTLQITIDGPEEVHDKRRFAQKGQPTFKKICEGIHLALDKGCKISIRTNVDKDNLNSLSKLNQFYVDKGWSKYPNFFPYAHLTHDWLEKEQIQPIELLDAAEHIFDPDEKEKGRRISTDFGISQCFGALLRPGEIPVLRPYFCGTNIGMYIFGPDGYIYTCWDEVGLEKGRIGQYLPELTWNKDRATEWLDRYVANIPKCLDCPYALVCGGGCASQAKKTTGSIFNPYCFQFQNLFPRLTPRLYYAYMEYKEKNINQKVETNICN